MSRKEIWTIGNRKWFERLMVLLSVGALGSWFYFGNAGFVKALESIVVFSVTGAFVILAGGEAMLGVLAEIRRQQREKGREEGEKKCSNGLENRRKQGCSLRSLLHILLKISSERKGERRGEKKCSNG